MSKDAVGKTCRVCKKTKKNDTYGDRCEDCYCEGLYSMQGTARNALYPKGTRVLKSKPPRKIPGG